MGHTFKKMADWPKLMEPRLLKSGLTGFYWNPPGKARKAGCPFGMKALGTDYVAAKKQCDEFLNPRYDAWLGGGDVDLPRKLSTVGTFDWMVAQYKTHPRYKNRPAKTRRGYDSGLYLASNYLLQDGTRFGASLLTDITPGAADKLFDDLRIVREPAIVKGKAVMQDRLRVATAKASMVVCKLAWNCAHRLQPGTVSRDNPFRGLLMEHKAKDTRAATHEELVAMVKAADESGQRSVGTAMMIAYYWLQRQVDILDRLSWADYRPADNPDIVKIFHHKTRVPIDMPLYDEDGTELWPELMQRLDSEVRRGELICTRDELDRTRHAYLKWDENYFRKAVRAVRTAAGIDPAVKFMGLRHGGNTEAGDAAVTDQQARALSGHKTPAMTKLYTKATMRQRREGARKRRDERQRVPAPALRVVGS